MKTHLLLATLGLLVSVGSACADGIPRYLPPARTGNHGFGPHASSVTWASAHPPGWYTNTYNYNWYYPWYAYYNFSCSPYANWTATKGYAGYAHHGPAGIHYWHQKPAEPYIGEWQGRVVGRPTAYDVLIGNLLPTPDKKDEKKDEKKDGTKEELKDKKDEPKKEQEQPKKE